MRIHFSSKVVENYLKLEKHCMKLFNKVGIFVLSNQFVIYINSTEKQTQHSASGKGGKGSEQEAGRQKRKDKRSDD